MESHSFCLNKLSYGSHSNEWDLSVFLYKGAVLENRRTILNSIKANKYGGVNRTGFVGDFLFKLGHLT